MLLYYIIVKFYVCVNCFIQVIRGKIMAWDLEIINLNDALPRVLGHKVMYKGWLDKFFADGSFAPVEAALASRDYEEAHNALHKIKGTASNLSIVKVYKHAEELERKLKDKADFDSLADEIKVLRAEFDEAKQMYSDNVDELMNFQCTV